MSYYRNTLFPHVPGARQMLMQLLIDPQKFKMLAHNLNDNLLNLLALRARLQGISEEDIQKGLEIIRLM